MIKKLLAPFFFFAFVGTAHAQVTVTEPDFIGSCCILTSDAAYAELPKETGSFQTHQTKVSRFAKLTSSLSNVAHAAGVVGISTAGSLSGVTNGLRVTSAASAVGSAADNIDFLTNAYGMDIVFPGKNSAYTVNTDGPVRLLIKAENNDYNPADIYRVVRFNTSKKERRFQFLEISSALLSSKDAADKNYINFTSQKYGEKSYLLTIDNSQLKSGEYGLLLMTSVTSAAMTVATFSVK